MSLYELQVHKTKLGDKNKKKNRQIDSRINNL
jgi:hypothetical protein